VKLRLLVPRYGALAAFALAAGIDLASGAPASDALVFAVSAKPPATDLSSADVRRVYLGQTSRWKDGRRIVLAVRPANIRVGRYFFDRVMRMSDIDFSRLWLGTIFRGEAVSAPRVLSRADEVRRFLWRSPDGLAFLLASELDAQDASIRPLRIDGAAPGERSYPFVLP